MRCRYCGSTALRNDSQRKNFSTGKAVAGAVTFGVVGTAAGFIGKDVAGYRCSACGQFMAEPMDFLLETQIDQAVRDAESGRDLTMVRYYQEQFPNVQAHIPAAAPQVQHAPVERKVAETTKKGEAKTAVKVKRCYEPGVWQPDCPIFVDAVILRTKDGEDLLSLSAVNLSEKEVRSAYFQAVVFDDTGDEVARRQCVYQNVDVPGGSAPVAKKRLPESKAYPLGTDLAHRVDVRCEKVAFSDDAVWRAEENAEPVELPAQPILSEKTFPRYKYIRSRILDADKKTQLRMPVDAGEYWLCDCGHPAKKDTPCSFCGDTLPALQEAFSQKTLEAAQTKAVRARAEKRARFSQKAYADALKANNERLYEKALKLEEKGTSASLREAIPVWEQISSYSDAQKHLEQCRVRVPELEAQEEAARKAAEAEKRRAEEEAARKAAEEKRIAEEAAAAAKKKRKKILAITIPALVAIIAAVFVVTKIVIPNSNYNKAVALMDAGNYNEALVVFQALDGYKDSDSKVQALWERVAQRDTIATNGKLTLGLKEDGTLNTAGLLADGDEAALEWTDLVDIEAGTYYILGLRSDGTVIMTDESGRTSGWTDIVQIAMGSFHAVGLRSDGTVVCSEDSGPEGMVSTWTNIVAVAAGGDHTVGLRADGTVVATGKNEYGECDVSDWTDIVAIAASYDSTVGLRSDGTVVAVGRNTYGECDVSGWKDIVAIAAGTGRTVGLRADGTVVTAGFSYDDEDAVSGWKNIVAVDVDQFIVVGLKADGTVVASGDEDSGNEDARAVSGWKNIRVPNAR